MVKKSLYLVIKKFQKIFWFRKNMSAKGVKMEKIVDCIIESLEKLRIRNNKLWEVAHMFGNGVEVSRAATQVYENGKLIGHITIKFTRLEEKKSDSEQQSLF